MERARRPPKKPSIYDCAIIGGGPGGLVSALYLKRFQRSVALIQFGKPRAAWIPNTHNLIGYVGGISGKLLLRRLEAQLKGLGLDCFEAEARVRRSGDAFEVQLQGKEILRARKVILATGIRDVEPALDNLSELKSKGLLRYCSVCDGYEYRDKPVALLASDDFGVQKGIFLSHWTKNIRFILPRGFRLSPQRVIELRRIRAKISRCNTLSVEARGGPADGVELRLDNAKAIFACAVYVELGCNVNDSAFAHLKGLRTSKAGFLIATTEQRTSVPGVFAVGDCVNLLGQLSVAAGQAAVAATTLHNDLLLTTSATTSAR